MANAQSEKRKSSYVWETKQDLYLHFEMTHGISRDIIDKAITASQKEFKLRKNKPIEPRELWQKTGLMLEQKLEGLKEGG